MKFIPIEEFQLKQGEYYLALMNDMHGYPLLPFTVYNGRNGLVPTNEDIKKHVDIIDITHLSKIVYP